MSPVRPTWVPPQSSVEFGHAHLGAVLLAEEADGTGCHRRVECHDPGPRLGVVENVGVDDLFDRAPLGIGQRLAVGEVKAQALGLDQRALLLDVAAEHAAERRMQQVRRRVIARGCPPARGVDLGVDLVANGESAAGHDAGMGDRFLELLRVSDGEQAVGARQLAAVADLATAFGVERGAIEHHAAGGTGLECVHTGTARVDEREDARRTGQ